MKLREAKLSSDNAVLCAEVASLRVAQGPTASVTQVEALHHEVLELQRRLFVVNPLVDVASNGGGVGGVVGNGSRSFSSTFDPWTGSSRVEELEREVTELRSKVANGENKTTLAKEYEICRETLYKYIRQ